MEKKQIFFLSTLELQVEMILSPLSIRLIAKKRVNTDRKEG